MSTRYNDALQSLPGPVAGLLDDLTDPDLYDIGSDIVGAIGDATSTVALTDDQAAELFNAIADQARVVADSLR